MQFPPPGDLPDQWMESGSFTLAGRFFTTWATREAPIISFQCHRYYYSVLPSPCFFNCLLSVIQLLSRVLFFATPWTLPLSPRICSNSCQLSQWCYLTISYSANSLLLLSSIFPIMRIFSSESAVCIRWPKYWIFSFSSSPSSEYSGLISFRID